MKMKHTELYYKKEETGQLLILDGTCKAVIPINDYHRMITYGISKEEKSERCKVASLCRLMDHLGYCENQDLELPTTISLRMKEDPDQFLMNPANVKPEEVEASLIIKTDINADISIDATLAIHQDFDEDAFLSHSAIYRHRDDIKCIIGVFNSDVVNIATNEREILPLCRSAAVLGKVKHHMLTTDLDDSDECEKIAKKLGNDSKVLLVSQVGAFCCGETIEEAFFYVENLLRAIEYQKNSSQFRFKIPLSEDQQVKIFNKSKLPVYKRNGEEYLIGEMSYEYHMRELDVRGYLTGYEYKQRWNSPLFTVHDMPDNFNETLEEAVYDQENDFDLSIDGDWQNSHSSHLQNNSNCHSMGSLHIPETIDEEKSNEIEMEKTPVVVIESVDVIKAVPTLESSPDSIQTTDGEISDSKELPVATEADSLDSTQEIKVQSASNQDPVNKDINGENDACEAGLTFEAFEEDIEQAIKQLNDLSDGSSKTNLFIEIHSAKEGKNGLEAPNLIENPQNGFDSSASNSNETQNNGEMSEEDQLEILDRELERIQKDMFDETPAEFSEHQGESQNILPNENRDEEMPNNVSNEIESNLLNNENVVEKVENSKPKKRKPRRKNRAHKKCRKPQREKSPVQIRFFIPMEDSIKSNAEKEVEALDNRVEIDSGMEKDIQESNDNADKRHIGIEDLPIDKLWPLMYNFPQRQP